MDDTRDKVIDVLVKAEAEILRLLAGLERVHVALQNPTMPRQSIGEMVAALINPKK